MRNIDETKIDICRTQVKAFFEQNALSYSEKIYILKIIEIETINDLIEGLIAEKYGLKEVKP